MSWNYRVVRRMVPTRLDGGGLEETYGIHEAYYEDGDSPDAKPVAISKDPIDPHGDDLAELKRDLEFMVKCLSMPVIEYETRERIEATLIKNVDGGGGES